jgi:hypothetical protein
MLKHTTILHTNQHPNLVHDGPGHSSMQITPNTYSHVSPGIQEAATERFDEASGTKYNEPAKETGWLAKYLYFHYVNNLVK